MDSQCWRFTSSSFKEGGGNTDDNWSWAQHWARQHWGQRWICVKHARFFYISSGPLSICGWVWVWVHVCVCLCTHPFDFQTRGLSWLSFWWKLMWVLYFQICSGLHLVIGLALEVFGPANCILLCISKEFRKDHLSCFVRNTVFRWIFADCD